MHYNMQLKCKALLNYCNKPKDRNLTYFVFMFCCKQVIFDYFSVLVIFSYNLLPLAEKPM